MGEHPTPAVTLEALRARIAFLEEALGSVLDRQGIDDALSRFTRGFDRQDEDLVRSAFWPDAQISYGRRQTSTVDGFIELHLAAHLQFGSYAHQLTNRTYDIDGDTAHVESYVTGYFRRSDDSSTLIAGFRYLDRFMRRDRAWRILVREAIPHCFVEVASVFDTAITDDLYPRSGRWRGTHDRRDPSYDRPLAVRDADTAASHFDR